MIVSSTAFLTSCADDLEVGKNIDESAYSGIYENNAYLRDGKSNLVSKVVELHGETYATTVKMGLSKTPNTATSAKVKIDAAYLETYNKAHNTDLSRKQKKRYWGGCCRKLHFPIMVSVGKTTAREMAEGPQKQHAAECAVATTGVAGPS